MKKFCNTNKSKKIILLRAKGQHSNRLIQNLHFEAFCAEYGIEYHNPTFAEGKYYLFPCSKETNFFINILRINFLGPLFKHSSIVKKIFSVAWLISKLGIVKYVEFDKYKRKKGKNCQKILLKALERSNTVFVSGWNFRVPELTEKHHEKIAARYSLKPEFYEKNTFYKKIVELKKEENILIGVHIRGGDYKKWLKGKYYFEDDVYEAYMNDISQKISTQTDKNQIFIIFSNDKVKFTESENLLISKESWYLDHHIMSLCDYIIGTRSTFPLWASYIGRNKFFCILDNSGKIENTISDLRLLFINV